MCKGLAFLQMVRKCIFLYLTYPGAPLTYFNDGGGGGPKDFFGSDILAKKDFFGSMKDADFFGSWKQQRDVFGYCIFDQLK